MALKDRPIRAGSLDPVIIAGYIDSSGDIVPSTDTINVSEEWRVNTLADTALDDSDKSFVVPAGQEWQILWVSVILVSTATVGNRQMTVRILTSGGTQIATAKAGVVQAASLTRRFLFAPAVADMTAFRDTSFLTTPIPPTWFLSPGQQVQVLDSGAIAAAADDMSVFIQYAWRTV